MNDDGRQQRPRLPVPPPPPPSGASGAKYEILPRLPNRNPYPRYPPARTKADQDYQDYGQTLRHNASPSHVIITIIDHQQQQHLHDDCHRLRPGARSSSTRDRSTVQVATSASKAFSAVGVGVSWRSSVTPYSGKGASSGSGAKRKRASHRDRKCANNSSQSQLLGSVTVVPTLNSSLFHRSQTRVSDLGLLCACNLPCGLAQLCPVAFQDDGK